MCITSQAPHGRYLSLFPRDDEEEKEKESKRAGPSNSARSSGSNESECGSIVISGGSGGPWSRIEVYEVGQQWALEGPFTLYPPPSAEAGYKSAAEEGEDVARIRAMGFPRQAYGHFVYVCTKR